MNPANYFDHAATGPVDPRVRKAMLPWLGEEFGNGHSVHQWGINARDTIEKCREVVAAALGAEDAQQIIFNSGATEGNNWVLWRHAGQECAISPFEHSSVRVLAAHFGVPVIANHGYSLDPATDKHLVSIVMVNNETGAIPRVPEAGGAKLHRDVTQAIGHVPVDVGDLDYATLSVHKSGGPQGVGILYIKEPQGAVPTMVGGGQEFGIRAGTLNVAGITGAATAVALARNECEQRAAHALRLRQVFLDELRHITDLTTDPESTRSPHILSLTHPGVLGETLVLEMDKAGFAISAGAACSSEAEELSPTLLALGYTPEMARGTIRISFGSANTEDSAAECAKKLSEALVFLRKSHTIERPL